MFRDKLIYRGKRLVNWDTMLQTAVSDDEVFHETVKGNFWYFNYPVIDPKPGEPKCVTLATTRPETMLGDTAVAVHPDPAAALDKAEAELKARLEAAPAKEKPDLQKQIDDLQERRRTMLGELETLARMARDGRKVRLPLLNREMPLVADVWAKPELGTGCVKITPAHDPNDYEVGLRQGLPMINILNFDGTLNENAGPYKGLTRSIGPEGRAGRPGEAGPAGQDRGPRDRAGPQRPLEDADRAALDRPVVRENGPPGPDGHGRRERRPREDHPGALREELSRLARRKARLADQPAALVGTSDSDLVLQDGQCGGSAERHSPAATTWSGIATNSTASG